MLWRGFTTAFLFGFCLEIFVFLWTYFKIILMKKKPYQTKEDTANYAEDPVVAYGNVSDGVSSTCGSFDASTCESNRMTVSEYFDEIRTVLRKKYENV